MRTLQLRDAGAVSGSPFPARDASVITTCERRVGRVVTCGPLVDLAEQRSKADEGWDHDGDGEFGRGKDVCND
jgi:hypothetical protein